MFFSCKADLHMHTALSPCADNDMTPPKIIHAARAKGLNLIAITDHNSCANTGAVLEAAVDSGIMVIPGMEVQTKEEIHIICLFRDLPSAMAWQDIVYQNLPDMKNKPEVFGAQNILDRYGGLIREEERLLLTATSLSVEKVISEVLSLGGICIPAHIDRPSYSLLSSLGFIPPGLAINALEISAQVYAEEARLLWPAIHDLNLIGSSDAHRLPDIGAQFTNLYYENKLSFDEIQLAIMGQKGRKVVPRVKELSMHIIDLIQNSIEAGASSVNTFIDEDQAKNTFKLKIADNGRGMEEDIKTKVTDPFFTTRTTRRIGLGIPLMKAACERCNGELVIDSTPGEGTTVVASFQYDHIDRAPLGNMIDTIVNTVVGNPELDFIYTHTINGRSMVFSAPELRRELVDVPLNNPAVIDWIRNYLIEGFRELNQ